MTTTHGRGRPQKFFYGGGQSRHFAYPVFQVVDDAIHMDVHKTLYPFDTIKKKPVLRQQSQKCASLAAMLLFHSGVFSHRTKLRGL